MKKNKYILIISILGFFYMLQADPIITVFLRPLEDHSQMTEKLKKPGKLAKYTVRAILQPTSIAGILATYSGYLTLSNYNGEIIFPRKHRKSAISIVVTTEIYPIPLFENTILNWSLVQGVPAKMYSFEQKYDDQKKYYYWDIQETELPKDSIIPLSAMVIIAKPKNIVINTGKVITHETSNLVLPDIYVKKGINIIKNNAYILTIRHFFKPIRFKENYEPIKNIRHVIE